MLSLTKFQTRAVGHSSTIVCRMDDRVRIIILWEPNKFLRNVK